MKQLQLHPSTLELLLSNILGSILNNPELKKLNSQFSPVHKPKGFSLHKVPNKKYGFLYYVRYIRNGKVVPSRWNTHTNNLKAAEIFARDNRERILTEYDSKHSGTDVLSIIENYYAKNSVLLKEAVELGRDIKHKARINYYNHIKDKFIPFLRNQNIKKYSDITLKTIKKYQIYLLGQGRKPQSINQSLAGIRTMLDHLVSEDVITNNILSNIKRLDDSKTKETHGCYQTEELFGIFNRIWGNEMSYTLNLIIHTTGLRNSEIERLTPTSIIKISKYHFLNIQESKTSNGTRIIPLHPFVYDKLIAYINKHNIGDNSSIFHGKGNKNRTMYTEAYVELGRRLGYTKENLEVENITFYSGRHYWKTLMSEYGLGNDVEEIFMGHKVSNNVAELYNHRNKYGQTFLLKKTKEMLAILDKTLFKGLAVK